MPVEVILASEFQYRSPIVNERTLAIIIRQSGETLDTMAALRKEPRRENFVYRQRRRQLHRPRIGRRALHLGRAERSLSQRPGIFHADGRSGSAGCPSRRAAQNDQRRRGEPPDCGHRRCLHRLSRSCPAASRSSITPRSISTTIPCSLSAGIWTMRSAWRVPETQARSPISTPEAYAFGRT